MFYRRFNYPNFDTPPAFIHQLSDEEMQRYNLDINSVSATFNIKYSNKEDTLMVEKLRAYLAELSAKKEEVFSEDHSAEIEAEVSAYRDSLIKSTEADRAAAIAKIDSDMNCISVLIDRELEGAITVSTEETITE